MKSNQAHIVWFCQINANFVFSFSFPPHPSIFFITALVVLALLLLLLLSTKHTNKYAQRQVQI